MSISVIIGTYGDPKWIETAERALDSVRTQTAAPHELIHIHGETLAMARNAGAEKASGEWLLFLDADDELHENYIKEMAAATREYPARPILFQPATLGVVDGRDDPFPVVIPRKNIHDGNYMVIGTLVEKKLFVEAGGFLEWPLYEDWCLWIRCFRQGADSVPVPNAIYRVHVNPNGRNNPDPALQLKTYKDIRRKHGL